MPRVRRPLHRIALLAVAAAGAACAAPAPPPPAPAPAPAPVAEAPPARDSAPAAQPPADTARAAPDEARPAAAPPARVCAGGDVTLGTNLDTAWAVLASRRMGRPVAALPDPARLLAPLRPLVRDADVVLLNIESAIGEGPFERKCSPGSTNCYAFRSPVGAAAALRALGGDAQVVGNVANNHAGDAGWDGRRQTVRHLAAAGIHVTGADTLPTLVPLPGGDTLAVLGFYTSEAGPDARDLAAVRRHVGRASERHARVLVTMHLGAEGAAAQRTRDTTEIFLERIDRGNPVAFARTAVEAGADLVVGHGPHVMRAAEWRGDALVLYSLGNLLTYGPFSFAEPMNRGAIACAVLEASGRVSEATLRSTVQRPPGIVAADPAARAAVLVDSLSRLDAGPRAPAMRIEAVLARPASDVSGAVLSRPGREAPAGARDPRRRD